MIIHGTTSATWAHGLAGAVPSIVFNGAGISQDPNASRVSPVYPASANAVYELDNLSVDLSNISDFYTLTEEGVADTYDSQNGATVRRVGKLVCQGTENWARASSGVFYLDLASMKPGDNIKCVCSHAGYSNTSLQEGISYGDPNASWNHRIRWFGIGSTYLNIASFKNFLATQYANGTPVTFYYPLNTPTSETNTAQVLNALIGENTISLTSGTAVDFTADVSALEDEPLITDRSGADYYLFQDLRKKITHRTATADEWNEWNDGVRNCIDASTLNKWGLYLYYIKTVAALSLTAKQNWVRGDINYTDAVALVNDIINVRTNITLPADTPTLDPFGAYGLTGGLNFTDYKKANDIEKILQAAIAVL